MAEKTITTANDVEAKAAAKEKIYVGALVSREVQGKLIEIGKSRDLSVSDVVREAIREHLAKQETD